MPDSTQRTFFKYCTADTAKAILSTGRLKWSSPRLFNDPFDGQINLLLDPNEDLLTEQIFESFMNHLFSTNPVDTYISPKMNAVLNFLRLSIQRSDGEFSQKDRLSLKEAAREGARHAIASFPEVNERIKELNRDISMFCVSEANDSIPMWSYYSQDHTGVVFEFLPYIYNSPLSVARPVNYVPSIPRLSGNELLNGKALPKTALDIISLTKYEKWSHEKEWRVVTTMRDKIKEFEFLPFNRRELGAVILGAKISPQDSQEIRQLTKTHFSHAKLYQASLGETEFKMEFNEFV